jgi:hypothetical protein
MGQTSAGPVQGPDGRPGHVRRQEASGGRRISTLANGHAGGEKPQREVNRDQPPGRRRWPAVAAFVILVVALTLLFPAVRHQWALSLIRQPAAFTALSFDDPSALPAYADKNQPITVSFTVSNQEGRATRYRYVLTESAAGKAETLEQSSKTVAPGSQWNVSTVVRPTCATSPCRVEVSLPGHPETIDFLVYLQPGS